VKRCEERSDEAISYNKIKEQIENGVKNLKGARLFAKTFSNNGFVDASGET
jgi:hypothetical protein